MYTDSVSVTIDNSDCELYTRRESFPPVSTTVDDYL